MYAFIFYNFLEISLQTTLKANIIKRYVYVYVEYIKTTYLLNKSNFREFFNSQHTFFFPYDCHNFLYFCYPDCNQNTLVWIIIVSLYSIINQIISFLSVLDCQHLILKLFYFQETLLEMISLWHVIQLPLIISLIILKVHFLIKLNQWTLILTLT